MVVVGIMPLHFFLEFLGKLIVASIQCGADFRNSFVGTWGIYGSVGFAGPEGDFV